MNEKFRAPRVLFVVSNEFGELSLAYSFARGLSADSLILVPERLAACAGPSFPVPQRTYRVPQDVTDAFTELEPDTVFLFSGYLLVADSLFAPSTLVAFLELVESSGCGLVTTDPLLIGNLPFDADDLAVWLPNRPKLSLALPFAATALAGAVHLYPTVSAARIHDRGIAVFAAEAVPLLADQESSDPVLSAVSLVSDKPRWLFILSQADYACEAGRYGRHNSSRVGPDVFFSILRARIEDAVRESRQPVFIGPAACVTQLYDLSAIGAVLLPFCEYRLFRRLLHDAEHVFYWNIFSHSIMQRIVNNQPIHFFAEGHMADGLRGFKARGMRCYFCDARLPLVSPEEHLSSPSLTLSASRQIHDFAEARANVAASLSPERAFESLRRHYPAPP